MFFFIDSQGIVPIGVEDFTCTEFSQRILGIFGQGINSKRGFYPQEDFEDFLEDFC